MNFKNNFINSYIKEHNLNIIGFDDNKPWGGYYIYESNDKQDKKILWIKPGNFLSLQFHGSKEHPGHSEEFTALTEMAVVMGNSDVAMNPEQLDEELKNLNIIKLKAQETMFTQSGVLHAYINPFDHDEFLLETRTSTIAENEKQREANITRIYDQTLRTGTVQWAIDLVERIKALAAK